MSTGDLKNNLKKLQAEVKSIKYPEALDVAGLTHGVPSAYLPIYNYAFTQFSHTVAALISGMDVELFGKSDLRFMESVYKVLRDLFSYKPPMTKDQFFSSGFKERKVIMCTEILSLIKTKHRELNPKEQQSNRMSSGSGFSSAKGVPRPKSATVELNVGTASKTEAEMKTRRIASSRQNPTRAPHPVKTTVIHPPLPNTQNIPSHFTEVSSSVQSIPPSSIPQFTDNMPISSSVQFSSCNPVVNEYTPDKKQIGYTVPETWIKTPSISKACAESVEIVTIPRNQKGHLSFDDSAVLDTFVLSTPDKRRKSDEEPEFQSLQLQITNLYESMNRVINKVNDIASRMQLLTDIQRDQQQSEEQVERNNLKARVLLLENRIAMLESHAVKNMVDMPMTQNGMNDTKSHQQFAISGNNPNGTELPRKKLPSVKQSGTVVDEHFDKCDKQSPFIEDSLNNKTETVDSAFVKPIERSVRSAGQKGSKAILKKLVDSHTTDFCDESTEFPSPIRQVEGKSEHYNESDASYLNLRMISDPRRTSTPNDISNVNGEASFHFTDKDMMEKVDRLKYM